MCRQGYDFIFFLMKIRFFSPLKKSNSRAETLAEAVMAITVLGIGAGGVMIMLNSAIRANDIGQERVVALNLAQEGVAAVEVLRDTNWLRFPGNRDECWDTLDATMATDCATISTKLATVGDADGETYVVYRELGTTDELMTWGFVNLTGFTTPAEATATQTVRQYTIGGEIFFSHALGGNASLPSTPTPGNFQRTVTVIEPDADTMEVTSTVTWTSRGQSHSVNFSSEFYNFL